MEGLPNQRARGASPLQVLWGLNMQLTPTKESWFSCQRCPWTPVCWCSRAHRVSLWFLWIPRFVWKLSPKLPQDSFSFGRCLLEIFFFFFCWSNFQYLRKDHWAFHPFEICWCLCLFLCAAIQCAVKNLCSGFVKVMTAEARWEESIVFSHHH